MHTLSGASAEDGEEQSQRDPREETDRELVERLRAKRPSLRTLYMSGYLDHPGRPRQGGLDPAVNLLEKPFAAQEILRKVRETLDAD